MTKTYMFIKVRVIAGAKKELFEQKDDVSFNISVKEPAKQNRANKRVVEIIATHYKVSNKMIRIVHGHHSTSKILSLRDD